MYSVRREHHYKDDAADSRQWRCPVERSPEPLVSRPVDQQLPELNQNQLSFLLLSPVGSTLVLVTCAERDDPSCDKIWLSWIEKWSFKLSNIICVIRGRVGLKKRI